MHRHNASIRRSATTEVFRVLSDTIHIFTSKQVESEVHGEETMEKTEQELRRMASLIDMYSI